MANESSTKSSSNSKKLTDEQIVNGFNSLRMQQKNFITKLTEIEQEETEHILVLETLKDCLPDRVCYQMIGGVLVERTVKDVTPSVAHNKTELQKTKEEINKQIEAKGREINEFKEKYNIQMKIREKLNVPSSAAEATKEDPKSTSSSVLVDSKT